jgi:ferredoxin-thioredoxin reductase catalytic subunit
MSVVPADRKEALRAQFQGVVDAMGYKFTPDTELVEWCLDQEVILEQKHGIPFCPCQGLNYKRDKDMRIVCPCIPWHRAHFDKMKRCWCGLFVHQDVVDPDKLVQLSEEEALR